MFQDSSQAKILIYYGDQIDQKDQIARSKNNHDKQAIEVLLNLVRLVRIPNKIIFLCFIKHLNQLMRHGCLSHMQAVKAETSLH